MRIMIIAVFLVSLLSCKKDIGMMRNQIVGTWEYERYAGYPFNQPVLSPGNGRIIVIGENGVYERKQHDTLLYRGSYSLGKKKDCQESSSEVTFSTSEDVGFLRYVEVSEGKLLLSTPNCYADGGTSIYIRVK